MVLQVQSLLSSPFVQINLIDQMLTWICRNGDLTKAFLASHEFSACNLILEEKIWIFYPLSGCELKAKWSKHIKNCSYCFQLSFFTTWSSALSEKLWNSLLQNGGTAIICHYSFEIVFNRNSYTQVLVW